MTTPLPKPNNTPPPAYSSLSTSANEAPLGTHRIQFGPTPISERQAILPYYDAQSPHSASIAASRAKWRFIEAFIWALVILWLLGLIGIGNIELRKGV